MGEPPAREECSMNGLRHEWRLVLRAPVSALALGLLLLLASLAVLSGSWEVARQRDSLARLQVLQRDELAALAAKPQTARQAGNAAYYTFHATWNPPAPAAFMALGLTDSAPNALRVRALALQSQLHEGEAFNPALSLAGRFDLAFVLIYLAPLVLIALLHDLVSAERQAGRLGTLMALPGGDHRLWLRRAALRTVLAFACVAGPLVAGAVVNGMPAPAMAAALATVAAYLAFWAALSVIVASRGRGSASHATALVGCWVLLTLVLPALANAALARAVPAQQGVDLALAQREAVHAAWDRPPAETMDRFFRSHPQWRATAPLPAGFHWKWYYAFQQLGDESVAAPVAAYRDSLLARQRWTVRLGWLLPGVGAQAALHRLAQTDLEAQLAYQDAIANFHGRLRAFYYPYLFDELKFGEADFAAQPRFEPAPQASAVPAAPLAGLALMALAALVAAARACRRVGAPDRGHAREPAQPSGLGAGGARA
jgi:ABC-2 type transport system permease protein